MKTNYTLRSLFALLLLTLLLSSCGDEEKKTDPKPKEYTVQVRVTGQLLQGLGADMSYTSAHNFVGPSTPGPNGTEDFSTITAGNVTKTYELGTFGDNDIIEGYINLRNVTRNGSTRIPSAGYFKMEIIVDGDVKQMIRLDATGEHTNATYNPHFRGYVALETDDL